MHINIYNIIIIIVKIVRKYIWKVYMQSEESSLSDFREILKLMLQNITKIRKPKFCGQARRIGQALHKLNKYIKIPSKYQVRGVFINPIIQEDSLTFVINFIILIYMIQEVLYSYIYSRGYSIATQSAVYIANDAKDISYCIIHLFLRFFIQFAYFVLNVCLK